MGPEEIKVAALSVKSDRWAIERNLKSLEKLFHAAAGEGANIICTPELALQGFYLPEAHEQEKFHSIAEPLDGANILELGRLAKELKVYIAVGFFERFEGEIFNSVALLDPRGKCLGAYRKVHLAEIESQYYRAGNQFNIFETDFGTIGLMTCFDRQFPETTRALSLQGARLILNPAAGGYGEWNQAMLRTRAYENKIYILFSHPMECFVVDPFGDLIAQKGQNETYLVRKIDLAFVDQLRSENCSRYKDIPELYGRWRNPYIFRRSDLY
jgi:deaminated glutathione amidase